MPLYTYKCQNESCDHSEDKIVKLAERDETRQCTVCDTLTMTREEFSAGDKGATFRYRGNWFATTRGY